MDPADKRLESQRLLALLVMAAARGLFALVRLRSGLA